MGLYRLSWPSRWGLKNQRFPSDGIHFQSLIIKKNFFEIISWTRDKSILILSFKIWSDFLPMHILNIHKLMNIYLYIYVYIWFAALSLIFTLFWQVIFQWTWSIYIYTELSSALINPCLFSSFNSYDLRACALVEMQD